MRRYWRATRGRCFRHCPTPGPLRPVPWERCQRLLHVRGTRRRLAVDALDHFARLKSGFLGWASRLNALNHCALHGLRRLQLLAHVRGEIG